METREDNLSLPEDLQKRLRDAYEPAPLPGGVETEILAAGDRAMHRLRHRRRNVWLMPVAAAALMALAAWAVWPYLPGNVAKRPAPPSVAIRDIVDVQRAALAVRDGREFTRGALGAADTNGDGRITQTDLDELSRRVVLIANTPRPRAAATGGVLTLGGAR